MNEYTVKVLQRGQPDRIFRTYARNYSEARFNVKADNSFWNWEVYTIRVVAEEKVRVKDYELLEGKVYEL